MLQKLTEEIAECYAHASQCRERAKEAVDSSIQRDLLDMEWRWLSLAHSYEFAERLSNFTAPFTKGKQKKQS